ncbi:unnamed protein product [Allacma fusca]|uniref:Protein kinase domain-containing protein n=1 Tax=Allacma fusca TaxID=39272 RepID=A0A8J2KV52_9HEXA|nr:unnamed protein product [Allacma fusca]
MQFVDIKCDRDGRPILVPPPKPKKLAIKDGVPANPGGEKKDYDFLNKFYSLHEIIGKGGFSAVRRATHIHTGEVVAVKIVDKRSKVNSELVVKAAIDQELRLLKSLDHPNLCKLFQEIHSLNFICMVQEYYPGGELFHYVQSKGRLSEFESRRIFRQVSSGLAYLHQNGVCHRDLKLENVLLDSSCNAKLIDFGLCAVCTSTDDAPLSMFCGSPTYAAPELVTCKPYIGYNTDIWSLGVVLYCCLNGFFPFYSTDYTELYALIQVGTYEEPDWLSKASKDIIRRLLQTDPALRPTVTEVLACPWCNEATEVVTFEEGIASNLNPTHGTAQNPGSCLNCSKMELQPFDDEIINKMSEFYGTGNDTLKRELSLCDFTSYVTSTYLILLERKRKYGIKLFKIFGVQIPKANNSSYRKRVTTTTYSPVIGNKMITESKQQFQECGGGDSYKTETPYAHESKSATKDEPLKTRPVITLKGPDQSGKTEIKKSTKTTSSTRSKLFSISQLAHRISDAFGRNKNDVGDFFVTMPPRVIDPFVAVTILKGALHSQGVEYTQNGSILYGTILRGNTTSSKPECVVKFEVEVQVREVLVKPLGTVQLSWRKLQGSTNFLRRAAEVITLSMKTLTSEKLLYRDRAFDVLNSSDWPRGLGKF